MASSELRNAAYYEIAEKLPLKRKRVFNAILVMGTATNIDIAEHLQVPINEVTGRAAELADMFLIKQVGERKGTQSGFRHTIWGPVESEERRKELIEKELDALDKRTFQLLDDLGKMIEELTISAESKELIQTELQKIDSKRSKLKSILT